RHAVRAATPRRGADGAARGAAGVVWLGAGAREACRADARYPVTSRSVAPIPPATARSAPATTRTARLVRRSVSITASLVPALPASGGAGARTVRMEDIMA